MPLSHNTSRSLCDQLCCTVLRNKAFFQPNPHVHGSSTTGIKGTLSTGFRAFDPALFLFALRNTSFWLTPHGIILSHSFTSSIFHSQWKKLLCSCRPSTVLFSTPLQELSYFFWLLGPSWNHICRRLSGRKSVKCFYLTNRSTGGNRKL